MKHRAVVTAAVRNKNNDFVAYLATESLSYLDGSPNLSFDGALLGCSSISEAGSVYNGTLYNHSFSLKIDNGDGKYNYLIKGNDKAFSVLIACHLSNQSYDDRFLLINGRVVEVSGEDSSEGEIDLSIVSNHQYALRGQFNYATYSGEANDEINSTPKLYVVGFSKNVLMPLLDGTSLEYQSHAIESPGFAFEVNAVYTNADPLTEIIDYTVSANNDVVTMLDSTKSVVVTADIKGEEDGSNNLNEYLSQILFSTLSDRKMNNFLASSASFDSDTAKTLSRFLNYSFDWADRETTSNEEFLSKFTASWSGWCAFSNAGSITDVKHRIGRWDTPHTRASVFYQEGDLVSNVSRELDLLGGLGRYVGGVRNWHVHNESDIAGQVLPKDRAAFLVDWRHKKEITGVSSDYENTNNCIMPTMLTNASDVNSEAAHRGLLFAQTKYIYRFTVSDVVRGPESPDAGMPIKVMFPNWNLDRGAWLNVLKYECDYITNTTTITAWGDEGMADPHRTSFVKSENWASAVGFANDSKKGTVWGTISIGREVLTRTSYILSIGGAPSLILALRVFVNNRLEILGRNSASTNILVIRSNSTLKTGKNYSFVFSWDLSTGDKHLYINDIDSLEVESLVFVDDTIPYAGASRWAIGDLASSSPIVANDYFSGCVSNIGLITNHYFDLSIESNRRRFFDEHGNAIRVENNDWSSLGNNRPEIYLPEGDSKDNFGSAESSSDYLHPLGGDSAPYKVPYKHFCSGQKEELTSSLAGMANNTEGAFCCFFKVDSDSGLTRDIFGHSRFKVRLNWYPVTSEYRIQILGYTTGGTLILDAESFGIPISNMRLWNSVLISWDLSLAPSVSIYVNNSDSLNKTNTLINGTIDYQFADFTIGVGLRTVVVSQMFLTRTYLDISDSNVRGACIDSESNLPLYLGYQGRFLEYTNGLEFLTYDGYSNQGTSSWGPVKPSLENIALDSPTDFRELPEQTI